MKFNFRFLQSEEHVPDWKLLYRVCKSCSVESRSFTGVCTECGTILFPETEHVKDIPRKEVYSGEIEAEDPMKTLEKLFEIFNVDPPSGYRGHSMSIGDLVVLDDAKYLCCGTGWRIVESSSDPKTKIESLDGKYRFLSNFFTLPVSIEHDGLEYKTVEHAYQACKTENPAFRQAIAMLPTAAEAEKSGKNMPLRNDWDTIKVSLMETLVVKKFLVNSDLRAQLLDTGDAILEEGNYWNDRFWGKCNGAGENHLGKILMRTRERFASIQRAKERFNAFHAHKEVSHAQEG